MAESYLEERGHLALKGLSLEPGLARRLPAELAWRFHALPLAEDRGRITVAMADPTDPAAREAVAAALGPAACVVRCDAEAIDSLLAEIWGDQTRQPLRALVCEHPSSLSPAVANYAEAFSNLLDACLNWLGSAEGEQEPAQQPWSDGHDLYIFQDRAHPKLRHLLSTQVESEARRRESRLAPAALVARQPRWPIDRILLVLTSGERESAALYWVLHLAHKARSSVTVLAVVPPVPAMYGHRPGISDGLPGLLTANSPLGQQMRQAARHLVAWQVEATLRLREGPPEIQIRREVAEGGYDLVAVASRPRRGAQGWLRGGGVSEALTWTDRPVLITRPTN